MSYYEEVYGTDWETLTEDEAMERAYALGVAAALGEYLPDELDALRREMDSSYQRSVIELAFDEGKTEGRAFDPADDADDRESAVWSELVEGETVTVDAEGLPTGGPNSIPEAVDKPDVLDRPERDSTETVELPDFLSRDED